MRAKRRLPWVGVLCAALLVASSAPALAQERVSGELRMGGGYDSNPALAADPGQRRLPSGGSSEPAVPALEDGLARFAGFIAASLGDSPAAAARFDLDARAYGHGVVLFAERLSLQGSVELDAIVLRCRLEGSRIDLPTTFSDESAWAAALACGPTLRLPAGFFLAADAEAGARFFDSGQLDGSGGGSVVAGWALDPVFLEIGLSVLRRESTEPDARRVDVAPWVALRVTTQYVGGQLAYRFVGRIFDDTTLSGGEHAGRLELWAMPLPWLGAFAEIELGHASGSSQALSYERVQVIAGARLALDWRSAPASLPVEREQGPATLVEPGSVRLVFHLPDAREVAVVGEFNGWQEARLERRDGGVFEGRFAVRSGRHEYHLVVDGEPTPPPGAGRYVQDDFGGENAVLVVP